MKKPKDDRESLRALVRELYYWAAHMGGWESPVWDKVDALVKAWDKDPDPLAGNSVAEHLGNFSGPVTAFHRSLARAMFCEPIPADYPVRPLDVDEPAKDRKTCGYCGWSWDDAIATGMTPAPGARCPFEYFHRPEMVEAGKAVRS